MPIQTIAVYDEPYKIGCDFIDNFDSGISQDVKDYLIHMNDFGEIRYAVIDSAVYAYDVIGNYQTVEEFIAACIEACDD